MLPIADDHPTRAVPVITWSIIAACVLTFFYELSLDESQIRCFIRSYGMIPSEVFGDRWNNPVHPECLQVPEVYTIFTSMFLHAGVFHLLFNMLFLWIFGDNIEDALSLDSLGFVFGWVRYLAFYLTCGVAAAATQAYFSLGTQGGDIPMIGASGAISGVLGAYLLLYPRAQILMVVFVFVTVLPAWMVLAVYMAIQITQVVFSDPDQAGVAFWAHIGGFVAGFVLIKIFGGQARPPHIPPSFSGGVSGRSLRCELMSRPPRGHKTTKTFSIVRSRPGPGRHGLG